MRSPLGVILPLLLAVVAACAQPTAAPPAAAATEAAAGAGVVKILGLRDGTPVQGSGFVVSVDRGQVEIVTAAHVIAGLQPLEVELAVAPGERFAAESILGAEFGNPRGLAALRVRGDLPAGIAALAFDAESPLVPAEELMIIGYPNRQTVAPLTLRRAFAGFEGSSLQLDRPSGEGISGAPVLRQGRVVGVVMEEDPQLTYAAGAVVARAAALGWKVNLGESSPVPTPEPEPEPPPKACIPGEVEERTVQGVVYVRICEGKFTMGLTADVALGQSDEKPAHPVRLSEFWIGKTEMTNEEYRRVRPTHPGEPFLPATGIPWPTAKAACERLGARLPTEAEWEYAARAGSDTLWPFGDDWRQLGDYAWYSHNSDIRVEPVARRRANAWGLYDMLGNAKEWVEDNYGPYSGAAQTDPVVHIPGEPLRVLRGGYALDGPAHLRSAARDASMPGNDGKYTGFRCVVGPRLPP